MSKMSLGGLAATYALKGHGSEAKDGQAVEGLG
jgi:hypothetical protein